MRSLRQLPLMFQLGLGMLLTLVALLLGLMSLFMLQDRELRFAQQVNVAASILSMSEGVRDTLEEKWLRGVFTPEMMVQIQRDESLSAEVRKARMLAMVPIVASWEQARSKSDEMHYEFRVVRENARNPENEPDAFEREVLARFAADDSLEEVAELDGRMLRYFRPVRLSETCLYCHGDPARSEALWQRSDGKDLTGFAMDGKQAGDLHGAFEILMYIDDAAPILPLTPLMSTVAVAFILLLCLLMTGLLMRRIVLRPMHRAGDVLWEIEQGRLDAAGVVDPAPQRGSEMARMMAALASMSQRLRHIVRHISHASGNVRLHAEALSEDSQQLSVRTQQQAQALQSNTASLTELAASVDSNAKATQRSSEQMRAFREQMHANLALAQQLKAAIESISQRSAQAVDIITHVDDIAKQTNLIAINTAVEAARAGEFGRSFSVVADEVRQLAQRSASAAEEIRQLITANQQAVDQGVVLTEHSAKEIQSMDSECGIIDQLVNEISHAVAEQAVAVQHLNSVVVKLESDNHNNAHLSEEILSRSSQLQQDAIGLERQVAYFSYQRAADDD